MDILETEFRLEDIVTSYYRVESIKRINYQQFVPRTQDDQWTIQSELILRKKNNKVLVALFSRELWCFSINDDDLPSPFVEGSNEVPHSEKKGSFTPDFSKPNLPTPYAIFLKALRRMIHINMCLSSDNKLIPFGNTCIFEQGNKTSKVFHFDSHLFENGDLTVSFCTKDMNNERLTMDSFNSPTLAQKAVYLAPSGIRAYLPSTDINKCLTSQPKNGNALLMILLVSHGIDLTKKSDIKWIKLVPNLNHLNGYTPTISRYSEECQNTKTVIWPMDLCYFQSPIDIVSYSTKKDSIVNNLQECFDMVDDFMQLKLTSAYRIPGTSANANTATGNNPTSTGGGFTDQMHSFNKYACNSAGNISQSTTKMKLTPTNKLQDAMRSGTSLSTDSFGNGFITTPNINKNTGSAMDEMIGCPSSAKSHGDGPNEGKIYNGQEKQGSSELKREESTNTIQGSADYDPMSFEEDLFGDDDERDLFGDDSGSDQKKGQKEINDNMFEMVDIESDSDNMIYPDRSAAEYNIQQTPLKRKYLDIPLDEITLPSTPLYMDPGAPLPVETPKDRRKSVFAPLNFNPIIESNVDNKYKNGGKFSFDPNEIDEPLKFEVSTTNFSSSEDDDSDFSGEQFGELHPSQLQSTRKLESSLPVSSYDMHPRPMNEYIPPENAKDEGLDVYQNSEGIDIDKLPSRESQLDQIWKSPAISHEESPGRTELSTMLKPTSLEDCVNIEPEQHNFNATSANYFESTSTVSGEEKLSLRVTPFEEKRDSQEEPAETAGGEYSLITKGSRETSNNLPFLLRHMPLFLIPDVFLSHNPSLKINSTLPDLLGILCDQLVFDHDLLGNFGINHPLFKHVRLSKDGVIRKTLSSLFTKFEKIHGNEIIDEMFYMKPPSVYVKKHGELIKVKSDTESFLKYLPLKPSKGMKNFRAFFLTTSLLNFHVSFINELAQLYSGQEFGFCELVKLANDENNGIVVLNNFNRESLLLLSAQIVSYCSTNMTNVRNVPLMLFLPVISASLEDTITMISKFQFIKNEVKSRLPDVEILLKLIPNETIRDPLVSIDQYYELCCSIYNLLPPKKVKFTSIADDLPDNVVFRTSSVNQSQIIHYDSYIHLAYTRSIDREWLCAAWSDSKGTENIVKAWHLGNSKSRFEEACNEIWKITVGLASTKYGRICLILTRMDSVLPDDELMHWRRLSITTRNLHLAVVCVGHNTKVSLYDEDINYPSFKQLYKDKSNANKVDPDALDDYVIVNIDEEIHGIIFKSPLQLANSQHRCSIKSGALLKFKPSAGNSTLDKFEVNLLNCQHSDSTALLKTILQQFRDLACLNSWFCISKKNDNYMPWHVVAVNKVMNFIVHVKGIEEKGQ
ncbi:HFL230Wp [Eremothecium sinecaudum]|uniref:Mediator of RNA polymerase II transcription subunit 13 n=1 Tax=Eremothecium sinecaudum TaxID=45286 RepID=A0A0X8HTN4_9SACH|nr:HFL230Wp [Eremothecium sinecaudum]AMD21626.1 HFL230Wp [Eremothecium sinecaudum]